MPFFSIIIPTFNRAHVIKRAIDSVLNQAFQDFELIVVDDGSTDGTRELLENTYGTKLRYVYQQNAGVCTARNTGAGLADGKYLIFLDSDDWLSVYSLDAYSKSAMAEGIKLVKGLITYYDQSGIKIQEIMPQNKGIHTGHPLSGSFALSNSLFQSVGGYDANLSYSETSDLFLRLAFEKGEVGVTIEGGVCIIKEETLGRRLRYSLKRYESVKYFLSKHRAFFDANVNHFANFKRIHAACALQNNHFNEARECLWQVLKRTPYSMRSHLHFYFVLLLPQVAKYYYSR